MYLNLSLKTINPSKDNLFQKYKNELINYDKIKKNILLSKSKFSLSEEKKNTLIQISYLENIRKKNNDKKFPSNLKKINLNRIIKDNKYKLKKPKFNSQLSYLKYYLLYSEPGLAKKSLKNIYDDLDKINNKINKYEEKEENKINEFEKRNKIKEEINNNNQMVVNIPDYTNKKGNVKNFLGLCGTYEKYNYEFSKIKNLFGTKINLFEKKDIIKKFIKNNDLNNNKTTSNFSYPKNRFKLFFPQIGKKIKKNGGINSKSFDKKKFRFNILSHKNSELIINKSKKIQSSSLKKGNIIVDNNTHKNVQIY